MSAVGYVYDALKIFWFLETQPTLVFTPQP